MKIRQLAVDVRIIDAVTDGQSLLPGIILFLSIVGRH